MIHRFGGIVLDEERRELRCGNEPIPIKPREFDVLQYLFEERGRTVPRLELEDRFWAKHPAPARVAGHALRALRAVLARTDVTVRSAYGQGVQLGLKSDGDDPPPTASAASRPLIGREKETGLLTAALDALLQDRGGVALIAGEPGIGKTRLCTELLEHAGRVRIMLVNAVCREHRAPLALWRDIAAQAPSRGAAEGRQIAAALGELSHGAATTADPTAAGAGDEQRRRVLVEAVVAWLGKAAARQPIVLALDDLQWADSASLAVLREAARLLAQERILVVATYRTPLDDGAALLRQTLDALRQTPHPMHISLQPLGEAEARVLVEQLAGEAIVAPTREAIVRQAEGNPFFVGEYCRHVLGMAEAAPHRALAPQLPATVGETMRARLAGLSPACRATVETAAVIGRDCGETLLIGSCDLTIAALLNGLDEAAQHQVLVAMPGRPTRYRFAHALLRDVAYDALAEERRRLLHQRVATGIAERAGDDLEAVLGELAHHLARGGHDPERAIAYATRAAEQADAAGSYEEAVRFYTLALTILEAERPALHAHRYDLILGLAVAHERAGQPAESAAAYARAAAERALLFLPEAAASPADDVSRPHTRTMLRFEVLLRSLSGERLAGETWQEVRRRRAAHAAAALARARRTGDARELLTALWQRRWTVDDREPAAVRLQLSTEMLAAAEETGAGETAQEARLFRIGDLLQHGRIDAFEQAIAAYARGAERDPEPLYEWTLTYLRGLQAQIASRLAEAEELASAALQIGAPLVGGLADAFFGMQLAVIRATQGRTVELAPMIEMAVQMQPEGAMLRCGLIDLNTRRGRLDEARAQLDDLAVNDFASIDEPGWISSIASLAESCAVLEAAAHAATLYRQLAPLSGCCAVSMLCSAFLGSIDGYLGIYAGAARQWNRAARHFEAALAMNARVKSPAVVAATQFAYARMLLAKGGVAARRRAGELRRAVSTAAHDLDLPGLAARADALG